MKNIFLTTMERTEIINAVENPSLANAELRAKLKKWLPKSCFVKGNKAAFNVDAIKKYILTEDEISFATVAAKRWGREVKEFPTASQRYEALKAVSLRDVGCQIPGPIMNEIANIMGTTISSNVSREDKDYVFDNIVGITKDDAYDIIERTAGRRFFATQIEKNMVANFQKKIESSKAKVVKALGFKILCDPSLREIAPEVDKFDKSLKGKVYAGTNMRPDIMMCYNEKGERKILLHEHFGWHGSTEYSKNQTKKLQKAIDGGMALFSSFDCRKSNKLRNYAADSSIYSQVVDWNIAKSYYSSDIATATWKALYSMASYAGVTKYLPDVEDIYFK